MSFNSTFSTIGNSNTANPFLFRDNQFTGDVNLSYVKGKHQFKTGFTYYHFDLNHFQPTTGGGVFERARRLRVRGRHDLRRLGYFVRQYRVQRSGRLPAWPAQFQRVRATAIQKAQQVFDPNSLRWTELGAYAQDQWTVTPKLTITYGVRFERYPAAYRDHTGISEVYLNRPQSSNVEIGGVMGNPKNAGVDTGYGFFAPRVGFAYRLDNKTVIRTGAGMTVDPDSMRELRDEYPFDLAPNYASDRSGNHRGGSGEWQRSHAHRRLRRDLLNVLLRHSDSSRAQLYLGLCGVADHRRDQRLVAEFPPRLHRELEPIPPARSRQGLRCQRRLCGRSVRPPTDRRQSV